MQISLIGIDSLREGRTCCSAKLGSDATSKCLDQTKSSHVASFTHRDTELARGLLLWEGFLVNPEQDSIDRIEEVGPDVHFVHEEKLKKVHVSGRTYCGIGRA